MDFSNNNIDYMSIQDMIDCDISTDMDSNMSSAHENFLYVIPSSSHSQTATSTGQIVFPSTQSQVDLNSSVSNLSWLHAVNVNAVQQQENRNPNLMVNPMTVAPISPVHAVPSNPIRVIEMTLPSNIQITGGSVKYVTVPPTMQQVYITTGKPVISVHQKPSQFQSSYSAHGYITASVASVPAVVENPYPKPSYSYSCLIAMALKNSKMGSLPVSEIYAFMMSNFPYFKTAPDGWKNSVRHNLSLNKCFEKIENPNSEGTNSRKGCLWALNPAKVKKMDEEIAKWNKKDPVAIKRSMAHPETFDILDKGRASSHVQIVSCTPSPNPSVLSTPAASFLSSAMQHRASSSIEMSEQKQSDDRFKMMPVDDMNAFVVDELNLDPSLGDLAFQNDIWEDLTADILDMPMSSSPTQFVHSPKKLSPLLASHPETATRYHGTYICSSTAASASTETFRTQTVTPPLVARIISAAT